MHSSPTQTEDGKPFAVTTDFTIQRNMHDCFNFNIREFDIRYIYSAVFLSGAPNDSFLLDPLKRYFRLSGVPLKLCRFISGRAIIFLSIRSF